jgi:hypothetical protein
MLPRTQAHETNPKVKSCPREFLAAMPQQKKSIQYTGDIQSWRNWRAPSYFAPRQQQVIRQQEKYDRRSCFRRPNAETSGKKQSQPALPSPETVRCFEMRWPGLQAAAPHRRRSRILHTGDGPAIVLHSHLACCPSPSGRVRSKRRDPGRWRGRERGGGGTTATREAFAGSSSLSLSPYLSLALSRLTI